MDRVSFIAGLVACVSLQTMAQEFVEVPLALPEAGKKGEVMIFTMELLL
jgi:hypothetical protein